MKKIASILLLIIIYTIPSYAISFFHIGSSEGLSQPTVLSICQDDLGRMWLGTREGLNIYNGNEMKIYMGNVTVPNGKNFNLGSHISLIKTDHKGNMYVLAENNLFRCNLKNNHYEQLTEGNATSTMSIQGDSIWYIVNQELKYYLPSNQQHHHVKDLAMQKIRAMEILGEKIFIGTLDGLHILSKDTSSMSTELKGNHIFRLFKSSKNEIWIGTSKEGIYKYADNQFTQLPALTFKKEGLQYLSIRDFIEDAVGNIWIGTSEGLQVYNRKQNIFMPINPPQYVGGFQDPSIYCLFLDKQENIWVGTLYGGASYFNPQKNRFTYYEYQSIDPSKKRFRNISQIVLDKRNNLWISTDGEGVSCLDNHWNIVKRLHTKTLKALPSNYVKALVYDERRDLLFIGMQQGGLGKYDFVNDKLTVYQLPDIKTTVDHSNVIYHLETYNGLIYLSTPKAIYQFNPETNRFTFVTQVFDYCYDFKINNKGILFARYKHCMKILPLATPSEEKLIDFSPNLTNVKISSFIIDDEGVYLATYGNGLIHYNIVTGEITDYHTGNSNIPTNYCYIGKYTGDNKIAITCAKGMILFNPQLKTFALIDKFKEKNLILRNSGLYTSPENNIFIGGNKGITQINLSEIALHTDEKSTIFFSNLYINNKHIDPHPGQEILSTSLPFTKRIHLKADENNVRIDLAFTDCTEEHDWKNYSYKLEGLDKGWNRSTSSSIHYNYLSPGKYTLHAKLNTSANTPVSSLEIYIARPLYARWWAICLYIGLIGLTLFKFHRYQRRHRLLILALQEEKFEKQKIEQLNHEKMVFFTNVSHEFRTPLTLIISHIDSLLTQSSIPTAVYNAVYKIKKNALHMNYLVTELLDFKKFSEDAFLLNLSEKDYVAYLKEIYLTYADMARQRNITFDFESISPIIRGWFDFQQMNKVLMNLLSNAFKYTPDGGKISIRTKEENHTIRIEITDSGVGISQEDMKHLFKRFYQGNNQRGQEQAPGTGIGLALTQLIVEKHHGRITVESEVGKGSTFTLYFPLDKEVFDQDTQVLFVNEETDTNQLPAIRTEETEMKASSVISQSQLNQLEEAEGTNQDAPKTILLVEDNFEILKVLVKLFKKQFRVLLARNGKEGLEKTFEFKPDLIISDIMMPEMNGTEMCLQIKNNIDLCHIPIILLTALTSEQQNIEGLNRGADDYICKPFNAQLLLARANNLIRNRLLIQSQISKRPITEVDLTSINPLDQKILKKTEEILTKNLDNTEFGLADLCVELSMGRSLLFTKFKALTGMTPNKYILNFRLKHAVSLIHHYPDMLITEVSDRCGFGSAVYFSRCFKNQYGVSPQNYKRNDS